MFLFHDIERGVVLGRAFVDHVLDATEAEAADLLKNPHWRQATEAEVTAAAEKTAAAAEAAKADAEAAASAAEAKVGKKKTADSEATA